MKQLKIDTVEAIVWRERNDFVAQCLNVDVSSYGSTKREALSSLKEALELYFEGDDVAISEVKRPELVQFQLGNA
ncbi:MAG: type II toxin-antitoxin system HicB family antitoxin [Patescibacteria group bacterium]